MISFRAEETLFILDAIIALCETDSCLLCSYRTTPTAEQILVPETLLKKRKAAEKTAEDRKAAAVERKKVSSHSLPLGKHVDLFMMHNNQTRLVQKTMLSYLTIFRV